MLSENTAHSQLRCTNAWFPRLSAVTFTFCLAQAESDLTFRAGMPKTMQESSFFLHAEEAVFSQHGLFDQMEEAAKKCFSAGPRDNASKQSFHFLDAKLCVACKGCSA